MFCRSHFLDLIFVCGGRQTKEIKKQNCKKERKVLSQTNNKSVATLIKWYLKLSLIDIVGFCKKI
jgi:hypothetical protein